MDLLEDLRSKNDSGFSKTNQGQARTGLIQKKDFKDDLNLLKYEDPTLAIIL